ncbi:carboxyl-terminal protease [Actinomadura craniellae]|uniref:Carboxyl-terminal protease n=1 Tax=Actinomadura craniellae TaxID=2231787 RepID=A0A365GZL2_9ACTN|nr:S41 family peptidase [Actinomadura craniellae]RAY12208.1 carboxyl-terminal protease [Actinomadura craniellae]
MFRLTGRALRGTTIAGVVVLAYGAGAVSSGGSEARPTGDPGVLDAAAERITAEAARPVPRAELERAAIEGMLRRLGDRWARFYPAHEYDDAQGRLNGRYSGVGLWLGTAGQAVQVASVQPDSAAARAEVRGGDVITAVDGRPVSGWDVGRVAAALRGRPATPVHLTLRRGEAMHTVRLVRAALHPGDVRVEQIAGGVRLIQISAFTRGVGGRIHDIVAGDPAEHRGGILLDLRGNPGGLLEEAVQVASAFLPGGPVVTYERQGAPPRRYDVTRPGDARTPLVVLVDAGTASAAEIVAGCLRDRDRAVIVGSRTFGKGSVQEPVRLPGGSAVELTVGRYRTPSGRSLDGVGIEPDVAVSADRPPREARRRGEAVLRGLLAALPAQVKGTPPTGGGKRRDRG